MRLCFSAARQRTSNGVRSRKTENTASSAASVGPLAQPPGHHCSGQEGQGNQPPSSMLAGDHQPAGGCSGVGSVRARIVRPGEEGCFGGDPGLSAHVNSLLSFLFSLFSSRFRRQPLCYWPSLGGTMTKVTQPRYESLAGYWKTPFVRSLAPRLRSGQALAAQNGRADWAALAEPRALASGPIHQFFNNLLGLGLRDSRKLHWPYPLFPVLSFFL